MEGDGNEILQHVQLHRRYPLILAPDAGGAATDGGVAGGAAMFTLQYQFKPASLDERSRGQLALGARGEASVQLRPGAGADVGAQEEAGETESYSFKGIKRPAPSTATECLLELRVEGGALLLRRVGQTVTGLRLHREQDVHADRQDKEQAVAISKEVMQQRKLPKRLQKKPAAPAKKTAAAAGSVSAAAAAVDTVTAAPAPTEQAAGAGGGDAGDVGDAGDAGDIGDSAAPAAAPAAAVAQASAVAAPKRRGKAAKTENT
jgi:hypothetical protein